PRAAKDSRVQDKSPRGAGALRFAPCTLRFSRKISRTVLGLSASASRQQSSRGATDPLTPNPSPPEYRGRGATEVKAMTINSGRQQKRQYRYRNGSIAKKRALFQSLFPDSRE